MKFIWHDEKIPTKGYLQAIRHEIDNQCIKKSERTKNYDLLVHHE